MKKIIAIISLFVVMLSLVGCSSFIEDESIAIQAITSEVLDDGRTMIMITYSDEETEPTIFYIPASKDGEKGEKGTGIQSVNYVLSEDGTKTIVEIRYTDTSVSPTIMEIPNGQDGKSIVGVDYRLDNITKNTLLYIKFSDGTQSNPIPVVKGSDGEDGNGITGYDIEENADGSVAITFYFSKSEDVIITIPSPKQGQSGNGIKEIISTSDDLKYYLTINYTNGESQTVDFPRSNKWYTGNVVPGDFIGIDGDYYFDIYHNTIYYKELGSWEIAVDFDDDEETYTIRFNLNDTLEEPADDIRYEFHIERGTYFSSNGYSVPVPTRDGYNFVGWYTIRTEGPEALSPTNGAFTDLTPVFSDMTLYACWEKIAL